MNNEVALRRALSPEIIALVLVVLVAVGGLLAVASGSPGPAAPTSPAASASANAGAVTPTATAMATSTLAIPTLPITTTPPPPTTAPSASAPTWTPATLALLAADERVIQWREALRTELAKRPKTSDGLAHLLRSINPAIQVASSSLDALDAAGAPPAIVGTLETAHRSALEAAVRTLQITLRDVTAYGRGATDVVAALEPLEAALEELAASAGIPPDKVPARPDLPIPSGVAP